MRSSTSSQELKAVLQEELCTIPPEASRKLMKVLDEEDVSIEAMVTKLEFAQHQVRTLSERVRHIEERYAAE